MKILVQTVSGVHPDSSGYHRGSLQRLKRPGREIDHSPPSMAWISNLIMAKGHTGCCGLIPGGMCMNSSKCYT
jgi:hypothetical protein